MKFEGGSKEAGTVRDESTEARRETYLEKHRALIKRAYEKARAIITQEAVNPSEYDEVYPVDEIEQDLLKTRNQQGKFTRDPIMEETSLSAEAFLYDQIGRNGWFSSRDVRVYPEKTSDTDDIFNKTDLVLTFETKAGEEPLAVTVDVTIGARTISDKIHSIKQEIDEQRLTTVKYHEKPSGERGALEKTPRVVLSLESDTLLSLLPLWLSGEPESRERLKKHRIQLDMAKEVEMQLVAYEKYARETGKGEIADRFKKACTVAHTICAEKERALNDGRSTEESRAVRDMRYALLSQLSRPIATSEKKFNETNTERLQREEIIRRLHR